MARRPRSQPPGQPQHIRQRGNDRMPMFREASDFHFFHECLDLACRRFECEVHAYVLMTNHVHLLMTPQREGGIPQVMQSLGRRYVRYFNVTYHRTGTLWEGRYRSTPIDSEPYLFACHRYIELNPVRAGLAPNPGAYEWSSHRANAQGTLDRLVSPHPRYRALAADDRRRRAAYRSLFRDELNESALRQIRSALLRGAAPQSGCFADDATWAPAVARAARGLESPL